MTKAKSLAVSALVVTCAVVKVSAAVYYVDFTDGVDTADGLSTMAAWQHSPGDPNATDVPAGTSPATGDTVIFKGGVLYRGSIMCGSSGTLGSPVTYDGNTAGTFGSGRAVIDGAEPLFGWTACTSSNDCGGNPNWQQIWMATLPTGVDVSSANLYANDEMLWLAQNPNLDDPFYQDDIGTYRSIYSDYVTRTSLTDSSYFTQSDAGYWDGAYLRLWGLPNVVRLLPITGFVPAEDRVTFADTGPNSLYTARNVYYATANHLLHLDQPGEFVVNEDGSRKIWLWPLTAGDPNLHEITVSVRRSGFDLNGHDYIAIQGFRIQKYTAGSGEYAAGMAVRTTIGGDGLVIYDNEMTMNRSQEHQGVIRMYGGCNDATVENNTIFENPNNRGVILTFDNSVFQSNTLYRNGGTAVDFYGCRDSQMLANTVTDHTGIHANGLTLYLDCQNCLVAYNMVFDGEVALTIQDATNITVAYNVLHTDRDTYTATDWGGAGHESDGLYYYNNVMLNAFGKALSKGSATINVVVRNNILDGCGVGSGSNISHNIYTDLFWNQSPTYGWSLGEGEFIETDKSVIFRDPLNRNFRLRADSPAIDAGVGVGLTQDLDGRPVPSGTGPDIGAYEYAIASLRVDNLPVSGLTFTSATLNGTVLLTSDPSDAVYMCWGDEDGGMFSTGDWDHVEYMGTNWTNDAVFSTNVTLDPVLTYHYYRAHIRSATEEDWADDVQVFTYGFDLPFVETFETIPSTMAGMLGPLGGQHGWIDLSANAQVQDGEAWEFDQAVRIGDASVSHTFDDGQSNVWTVFAWKPTRGGMDVAEVPGDATVIFWVNENGTLSAYSNQIPIDTGGAVNTSVWSRIQVHSDYAAKAWSLWQDGAQVIDNFGFFTDTLAGLAGVQFRAYEDSAFYVDDVRIGTAAWNPQPGDTDGDGLPDDWELLHFKSPNVSDGSGDADGDGANDGGEEIAGTDPTDDASVFAITNIIADTLPSNTVIHWPGVAGRLYAVEGNTDLVDGSWSNIASNLPATPPDNVYTVQVDGVKMRLNRVGVRKE